jgi:hypothetical protein
VLDPKTAWNITAWIAARKRSQIGSSYPNDGSVQRNHPASPGANVGEQIGGLGFFSLLANLCSWREMSGGEAEQQSRVAKTSHPAMPYRTSKIL